MTEFAEIMQRYGYTVVPLADWLAVDIVRLIELLDAELQNRLQNRSDQFGDDFDIDDCDVYDFEPNTGEDDV